MPPHTIGPPRQASQISSNVAVVNGCGEINSHTSRPDSFSKANKLFTSPSVWLPTFLPCACSVSQ